MNRTVLLAWLNEHLKVDAFKDYAPNGLQVEGTENIQHILCAVTASQAAIDAAVTQGADTLLVHHGMFWKSEPAGIVGWKKRRIFSLLQNDINLLGYHLPLDAHPKWGNNATLAAKLGIDIEQCVGEQGLLNIGYLSEAMTLTEFQVRMQNTLNRSPLVIGQPDQVIRKVALCTGGAQGFFQLAIDHQVDVFITGEVSEAQYHLANETGVAFISAGHHATERYGVQALASAIAGEFDVSVSFFDEANPV